MYPTLFHILGFPISSFGVMVALAFLVGTALTARAFEDAGLSREIPWRILTWCMVGGVVGSKLWYAAEQLMRLDAGFWASFFSRAGMTWYGGLAGGVLLGYLGARREGVPVLAAFNLTSPALALAHAIGRVGCLLVGDDYGKETDAAWGIEFPEGSPPTEGIPVHPTMVYETLWLLPVAAWLWMRRATSPFLFGEYLLLAGLGRLWIEHFRTNPDVVGPFSNAQLVALASIAVGAASWIWMRTRGASQPT